MPCAVGNYFYGFTRLAHCVSHLLQCIEALGILHAALVRVWPGIAKILTAASARGRTTCNNGIGRLERIFAREIQITLAEKVMEFEEGMH